ncbi:hypothetical protein I4U23_010868 [Adineta vaga]|nr:hypothetical protein I4U23_010868 [Adineta vaga]
MDTYLQPSLLGEDGELYIGGTAIFSGYYRRDDLTKHVIIYINDELFYRTGDLVKFDNKGLLYYQGRKDFQIKLHGQRIELGEIERCLLSITSISTCVVMKWGQHHLVAYVQSSVVSEKELHEYCQSHLPPHMIPSHFIILDKLPLNPNGKIDRKHLPSPNFSSATVSTDNHFEAPLNELESRICNVWRQVLDYKGHHISRTTNFFTIGGHSLLFIELYHRYQSLFNFDTHTLLLGSFIQQPTIFQHSQLLQTVTNNDMQATVWHSLHINRGIASFAQERISLDEQVRFSKNIAIYNELMVLRITQGSLSFTRLLKTLQYILNKHKILHTSIKFNTNNGILEQYITDTNNTFTIVANRTFKDNNELQNIITQLTIDPNLFDLSIGRVFHCQILQHQNSINKNNDNQRVKSSDVLVIGFHHVAFDRSSQPIFFKDFCFAYNNASEWSEKDDEEALQYIDYTIHERQIDMKPSQEFWFSQLETYNFERPLLLPYDRSRSSNHERSGLASTIHITLNDQISTSIVNYASSQHVTLFQLGLSIFHLFLSRLTRDDDLCISCLNANRYRAELHNVIGMFVATLPYRIHLNANWSFDELVHYVKERCLSILEHSHYPLQHILSVFHLNQSNLSFLETMFDFITLSESVTYLLMNDTKLEPVMLEQSNEAAKFDFMLTFIYDPTFENGKLSFSLVGSHDLFDKKTIASIAERFSYCIEQLFSSTETMNEMDTCLISRSRLSLILPSEASEIDDVIFCRQPHIMFEVEVLRKLSKGFVDATKLPKALKYQKKQLLKSAKI